ncbi:hypothetical protein BKN38_05330 [Helicobacter sp. CLO-3]|uniref:hypothetical protein n=1 Tax=unclassified Helicobacter TaxID=2593540 RepID=UPI0008053F55|nr:MULTISPECIES: hypothetical protein [unclassified Helicobacter]OBV30130.1 hypothetical protein BA723_02475 [Helicobacter sp. CLO-3]OHU83526.1 hypothetical protein BKN38_05330 [Helicobacter sp. CLO-3]
MPDNPQNPQRFRLKAAFQYCLKNFFYLALPLIVFIIYYFLYIRFQSSDYFYRFFQEGFLPHNIKEYPKFIKEVWLGVYQSYTPFLTTNAVRFYALACIFGLFALYKQRRDIFYICVFSLFIDIALSWFRIYPFGRNEFIGGRLSLFMSVIFYISICYFLYALHLSKKFYIRIIANLLLATITIAAFVAYKKPIIKHQFFTYQQMHVHITNIANNASARDVVFLSELTKPAFFYYSYLENIKIPHKIINDDLKLLESELIQIFDSGANIWILASHYSFELKEEIMIIARRVFENKADLTISTKDGAMFIKIAHKKYDSAPT